MTHPLAALLKDVPRYQTLSGNMLPEAAVLAALSAAHHVNETPKSEHDRADVLTALAASEARVAKLVEALKVARAHVANNADGWSVSRGAARVDLTIVDAALSEAEAAQIAGLEATIRKFQTVADDWECPLGVKGCAENCGNYGCGN